MANLPHEKKIEEYENNVRRFKEQNKDNPLFASEISKLESKLDNLKAKIYSELNPTERLAICRHPSRPHTIHYIENICDEFTELFGDRNYADDSAVVGGIARIGGQKFMIIGQEKGHDTETRVQRNFGMLNPEGFRKALRLAKLAEKFHIPIVSLLDTPGAFPGLEAEERGQGWAIAMNLREFARLKTPILIIIIGEGFSGGALGTGVGDVVGMLQHAYYSVISPEGCASILWKDAAKKNDATVALKGNAEDLLELGVIDAMIPEPLGGAHKNPGVVFTNVKAFILEQYDELKDLSPEILVENRYVKYRKMGVTQSD
ncbi:MAG: acetyl-CoA carboxylase carboxyl transferase subunit alpha [Waddliaceae bacterium]|nr:acetyl-CoA carboxylase carboxyl transferase subunit alpha [Waddliaceae bacterium]